MKSLSLRVAGLVMACVATPCFADTDCNAFKWDASKERALFATAAQSAKAGSDTATAPQLSISRLYALTLQSQASSKLAAEPGKKTTLDNAFAGLAKVHIEAAGNYRIALDKPMWIDVVQVGKVIPSADFHGLAGCNAPHKIVEFALPTGDVLVQLSGSASAQAQISITAVSPH